jgi:hypothetical protein
MTTAGSTAFMPLYSIEVLHQYLSGGPYGTFAVTPLGDTQKIMQHYGWAAAQMENKFTLYAAPTRAATILKPGPAVPLNAPDLCFAMEFRDPDFATYTDLPVRAGCVLSFSDISNQHHVSATDLVMVQTGCFQCPVAENAARGELWLENLSGGKVMSLPSSEHDHVKVDTAALPIGLYHVVRAGRRIESFIKLVSALRVQPCATICISVQQLLNALQHHSDQSNPSTRESVCDIPHALLSFPARSTFWRYDLFNHSGSAARDYAIVPAASSSTSDQIAFKQVPGVALPNGENSLAFESTSAIPLAAHPRDRFMLLRHNKTLIAELPTPGLELTRNSEGVSLCSRQCIYL